MNKAALISVLFFFVAVGSEGRSLSPSASEEIFVPVDVDAASNADNGDVTSPGGSEGEEEEFYVYYPLAIVNGSVEVVGRPILYKASEFGNGTTTTGGRRTKRQFGINILTAFLGGALGGGAGGLVGGTVLAPLGPVGSAVGGGVGAGIGAAIGAGLGGGGPGAFLLGGAAGATFGSIGGLLLGPLGASTLGLIGGGLGGALGSIG